jgi:hypothetical protein
MVLAERRKTSVVWDTWRVDPCTLWSSCDFVGRKVRYLASDELTCNEIAGIIGEAIGKPDLKWVIVSDEEMQSALIRFVMSKQIAVGPVEMNANLHNGSFVEDYYRNRPAVMGKAKIKDFEKEFAATFQKN